MGRSLTALIGSLVVCLGAGWAGAALTHPALAGWYAHLAKPTWTPPGWMIATVWRTLFALMGVAVWMVVMRRPERSRTARWALAFFVLQLALNVKWSHFFFVQHRLDAALADIIALWFAILATMVAFWRVRPAAGALLLPYISWVAFAAALNETIWRMNPH